MARAQQAEEVRCVQVSVLIHKRHVVSTVGLSSCLLILIYLVYSVNMPKQIPLLLFVRKFIQKIFWAIVLGIRGVLVVTIWLAIIPYVTIWTWRFYFVMGDNL